MHFRFPEELRCFYSEIGYGFIKGSKSFTNRIMPPDDVADYVCFDSFFEYVDRSIYSAEDILFFHLSDEDFLMIRKDGKIVYFGEVIADSFIDFMRKELEVPGYLSCGVSHIHQLFKAAAAIYQTGFICQLKAALLIKCTRIKVCFQYPKHDRTILIF